VTQPNRKLVVAALKSVVAETDLDEKFNDAVFKWVYTKADSEDLESFVRSHPDYLDHVDKGMQYQPLYRAVLIPAKVFLKLIKQGLGEYRHHPSPFESWTFDKLLAQSWNDQFSTAPDVCSVVFKMNIPEDDRVVCIPCIDDENNEAEIITWLQTKQAKDIHKIYIRAEEALDEEDDWNEVSLKDAVAWAEV